MVCSAHLLSQSLYSSHCSSSAGPNNLRSQGRPPARASPAARPGSRARGCRGVVSLRVAASFEEGRRQVEVSAFLNPSIMNVNGEFGKDCSDCGRKCRKPKDSAALFVCYAFWECTKWETGEGISFLRGFCPFPPRRFSRAPLPTSRDATVALCQSGRLLSSARSVPSRPVPHSTAKPNHREMCFLAAMKKRVQLPAVSFTGSFFFL